MAITAFSGNEFHRPTTQSILPPPTGTATPKMNALCPVERIRRLPSEKGDLNPLNHAKASYPVMGLLGLAQDHAR